MKFVCAECKQEWPYVETDKAVLRAHEQTYGHHIVIYLRPLDEAFDEPEDSH